MLVEQDAGGGRGRLARRYIAVFRDGPLVDRYNLDTQLPVVHDDTPVANIPDTRCVVQNSKGQCIGVVNAGKAWR